MKCINEILKAANGAISRAEAEKILNSVGARMKRPRPPMKETATPEAMQAYREKLQSLSAEEQVQEAARVAFADALFEKERMLQNRMKQIEKVSQGQVRISLDPAGQMKGLISDLVGRPGGKQSELSFQAREKGIARIYLGRLMPALDHYMGKMGWRFDKADEEAVTRALFGEKVEDAHAMELAETVRNINEDLRQRKNRAGADVGHLEKYAMPQSWSRSAFKYAGMGLKDEAAYLMADKATRDRYLSKAKEEFVKDAFSKIDRDMHTYFDDAGNPFTDEQLRAFLGHAWETVAFDGLNKEPQGAGRGRALANRLGQERQLHFKSAEDFLFMNRKYGAHDVLNGILGHVQQSSRELALLEAYGPNPQTTFETLHNYAAHADLSRNDSKLARTIWGEITGSNNRPESERAELVAGIMKNTRNMLVSSKLGSAFVSQLTDVATFVAVAQSDGLGAGKAVRMLLQEINPANAADRRLARRLGFAADEWANDVSRRFGESTQQGAGLTSKFARGTIELSLMGYLVRSEKLAAQKLISFHLADAQALPHEQLTGRFRDMMNRYGITAEEWALIRQAPTVEIRGEKLLTPEGILSLEGHAPEAVREAALKVAALLTEEADIMFATPDYKVMAKMKGSATPGSFDGEFRRSFAMFRTFAQSMRERVFPRIFESYEGAGMSRAAIATQFMITSMVLAGLSVQMKEMKEGRNPRDMFTPGFWLAALLQAGGLGIWGDFVFGEKNRFGQGAVTTLAGPVAGLGEDLYHLYSSVKEGEDVTSQGIRFAKSYAPVINLWYTKLAFDHLLFFHVQNAANPGYLRRMRRKVERQNNQSFWWAPEDSFPEELPNVKAMFGGE